MHWENLLLLLASLLLGIAFGMWYRRRPSVMKLREMFDWLEENDQAAKEALLKLVSERDDFDRDDMLTLRRAMAKAPEEVRDEIEMLLFNFHDRDD